MPDQTSRLLQLVGDVQGLLDIDELRRELLVALPRLMAADWVSINDLHADPHRTVVLIAPEFPMTEHEVFARFAHENPLVQRYQRTRDGRAYRFSDVTTVTRLSETALYRKFYGPIGLQHQIAFTLPHTGDRLLAIALSRREHDYTDGERDLLNLARPFLIQAYRNAIEHTELRAHVLRAEAGPQLTSALSARGLTARESEIVAWIAVGRSNRSIAETLEISERTVQTHLRNAYRKLAVRTRSDAAALAWTFSTTASPS